MKSKKFAVIAAFLSASMLFASCAENMTSKETIVVNLNGLTGENTHNYYLYESDGKISLIPWDYDVAFGGLMLSDDKMYALKTKEMKTERLIRKTGLLKKKKPMQTKQGKLLISR